MHWFSTFLFTAPKETCAQPVTLQMLEGNQTMQIRQISPTIFAKKSSSAEQYAQEHCVHHTRWFTTFWRWTLSFKLRVKVRPTQTNNWRISSETWFRRIFSTPSFKSSFPSRQPNIPSWLTTRRRYHRETVSKKIYLDPKTWWILCSWSFYRYMPPWNLQD